MAKHDLTNRQQKIVSRYYQHRGTIAFTKLQELASELFLAEAEGKSTKALWGRVEKAVGQLKKDAAEAERRGEAAGESPSMAALRHAIDAKDAAKLAAAAK